MTSHNNINYTISNNKATNEAATKRKSTLSETNSEMFSRSLVMKAI